MIDFEHVQRIVLRAPSGAHVAHLILRVRADDDRGKAEDAPWLMRGGQRGREFVEWLLRHGNLAFGPEPGKGIETSVGFTFRGLQTIDVPRGYLAMMARLSKPFVQGAAARAAQYLGDGGASGAERWLPQFATDLAHVVVSIHGPDRQAIDREVRPLKEAAERLGLQVIGRTLYGQPMTIPGTEHQGVHFGYRDGLSKVLVRGFPTTPESAHPKHEPGEFLLGCPSDHRSNPWLLRDGRPHRIREFFAGGTFGVLRVVEQDVEAFESAVDTWARQVAKERGKPGDMTLPGHDGKTWRDYVKAKLCGRWPDGRLFDPKNGDGPSDADPCGEFDHLGDRQGFGCPLGAHIRRLNPRELSANGESPPPRGYGVAHARARPLIRRGTPYGPAQDKSCGLLGWFFCADLERQFEHLLGQWADRTPLGSADPGDAKDPLAGQHESATSEFVIPRCDAKGGALRPHRLSGFRPFCTTRGTLYALYPTRVALGRMVRQEYLLKDDPDDDDYERY